MKVVSEPRGKSKASKRPYMKLFTSDYRDGTLKLSFELQGLYFRILTYLHDGDAVPADPVALATFLHCNSRTIRALLPKLVAAGKLFEQDGELRNPRIERDLNPNSSPIEGEVELNSMPIHSEVEPNSSRRNPKAESNQDVAEPHYGEATATAIPIAIPEQDSLPASVELDAPSEGLAGLNGMAASMIQDVMAWMNGGDERCAKTWLANTSRTYGSEITKQAYQKLGTDMLEGAAVARPLQTWSAIARRMKDAAPAARDGPPKAAVGFRAQNIENSRAFLREIGVEL
jgi:uncharacterized protein YdaU (DUF1376 family)